MCMCMQNKYRNRWTSDKWQSFFIMGIERVVDKDAKIRMLIERVITLERQNQTLKKKLSGIKHKDIELVPIKTQTAKDFYNSLRWKKTRFHVLSTRDKKCVLCGSTKSLHVDHIIPRSVEPEKSFDLNNLQILCSDCNIGKHTKTFKA